MFWFILLSAVVSLIDNTNSYVLVQVRKGENESNVDALIHKVVPSEQLDKLTDAMRSRKRFSNFKRFQIRQRTEDDAPEPEKKENDGIILGLDTGNGSQNVETSTTDGIDKIEKIILNLAKTKKIGGPMMRAREDYNIRPQVVKLRGGNEKPSVMVKVDSESIISAVKELLSSKAIAKYTDKVAQKAAVVYRALKEEMGQGQRSKNKYYK